MLGPLQICLFAQQNSPEPIVSVKVYLNAFKETIHDRTEQNSAGLKTRYVIKEGWVGIPSLAVQMHSRTIWSHELEILPIWYDVKRNSLEVEINNQLVEMTMQETIISSSSLRYQCISTLARKKRFRPYLGASAHLYYRSENFIPTEKIFLEPFTERLLQLNFQAVSGFQWHFAGPISLDMNSPIYLLQAEKETKIDEDQNGIKQKIVQWNNSSFPAIIHFRFGIVYTL